MNISKFKIFLLNWIVKRIVIQGPHHKHNIIKFYEIINKATKKEFNENNGLNINKFLSDCHKKSLPEFKE